MRSVILVSCGAAFALSTHAAVITSVGDPAGFAATLLSPKTETFDGIPTGTLAQGVPVPLGLLTVTANGTSSFSSDFQIFEQGPGDNALGLFPDVSAPGFIPDYTFDFGGPVDAFGAFFESPASADGATITIGSDVVDLATLAGVDPSGVTFVGFTSDTPFQTFTLGVNAGGFEGVVVDDLTFGNLIPEPASMLLVLLAAPLAMRR